MRLWWLWALGLASLAAAVYWGPRLIQRVEAPIVVGLVYSKTGPLAVVEGPMLDAATLALEEINEEGGLLGRRLAWEVGDGRSDSQEFGREARRLIESGQATVLFGGSISVCRRAMEEVAAPAKRLVVYSGTSEGMEVQAHAIGTGPMPNQDAVPAVSWCVETLKAKTVFLVGSAGVSSYAINAVVRGQLKALGIACAGEAYAGLDGSGMVEAVGALKASGADVALSSIVGDSNREFFRRLTAAGLTAETTPVVSLRLSEDDLRAIPAEDVAGHYAAAAYFQSIEIDANRRFVERFKAKYGADRPTSDPVAAAYYAVKLWAQAVMEAETVESSEVREHISRQSLEAAEGVVSIDHDTLHTWRPIRVGKARSDGQFDVVWSLLRPIQPVPFPVFQTQAEWRDALRQWRDGVGPVPVLAPSRDEPAPIAPTTSMPATPPPTPVRAPGPPVVWGPRGEVRASGPGGPSRLTPPPAPVRSAATPRPEAR